MDKLVCKFPFLKIDEFIEEFVNGVYNKDFFSKYNFSKRSDFDTCIRNKALNFPSKRLRLQTASKYERHANLKVTHIHTSYVFLKSECDFFKEELIDLFYYNIVRSRFLITLLIDNFSIEQIIKNTKFYDVDKFEYFNLEKLTSEQIMMLEKNVDDIKTELYVEKMITYARGEYRLNVNFNDCCDCSV